MINCLLADPMFNRLSPNFVIIFHLVWQELFALCNSRRVQVPCMNPDDCALVA